MALPDYTGRRFSRTTVIKFIGVNPRKQRCYECLCDCGTTFVASGSSLKAKYVESCGCLQIEKATENLKIAQANQIVHGMSGTLTYQSWKAMMDRCFDRRREIFNRYGARGITVCQYISETPRNLLALIGERPSQKYSLDRINVKLCYSCGSCENCKANNWPKNVQWATAQEQACNRSNNVWITMNGEKKTRSQWAEKLGISYKKACWVLRKYEMKYNKVEINLPPGVMPEGLKPGEEFDAVTTYRMGENGMACVVQVGDVKMEGYGDKDNGPKSMPAPGYGDYAKGMVGSMGQDQG